MPKVSLTPQPLYMMARCRSVRGLQEPDRFTRHLSCQDGSQFGHDETDRRSVAVAESMVMTILEF